MRDWTLCSCEEQSNYAQPFQITVINLNFIRRTMCKDIRTKTSSLGWLCSAQPDKWTLPKWLRGPSRLPNKSGSSQVNFHANSHVRMVWHKRTDVIEGDKMYLSVPKNRNRRKIAAFSNRKVLNRRFCHRNRRKIARKSRKKSQKNR